MIRGVPGTQRLATPPSGNGDNMKLVTTTYLTFILCLMLSCSSSWGDDDTSTPADDDDDTSGGGDDDDEFPDDIPPSDDGGPRQDLLSCTCETVEEDEETFHAHITLANENTEYVWNGYYFAIWSVDLLTTSIITQVEWAPYTPLWYSHSDDKLTIETEWDGLFPLGRTFEIDVWGTKDGPYPYLSRCDPWYVRGDIIYPQYDGVPYTWTPEKPDLDADDLIEDEAVYYQEELDPITDGVILYDPPHPTQIQIGLPEVVDYTVNSYDNLRIFMPSEMLAMGIAFNYEWFKYNPNYFCALGTKENFACGLVPRGFTEPSDHVVTLDGDEYDWYILFETTDGPFQQTEMNFDDMALFYPDYFPDGPDFADYIPVYEDSEDSLWARSVITSAISSVVSRETFWASNNEAYTQLVLEGADPYGELAMVTHSYNMGVWSTCTLGVLNDIDQALLSDDIVHDYGLFGQYDHVATVRGITDSMNKASDEPYDTELDWAQIDAFFEVVRDFYPRGVPSEAEWAVMLEDVHAAFDVLAVHWGGDTISYRYDFLTLLRVAREHLPEPTVPRPTTEYWYWRLVGLSC